jgi:glucose/arabinose dehydrogenase
MTLRTLSRGLIAALLLITLLSLIPAPTARSSGEAQNTLPLDTITLPEGFDISVYARAAGARSMTLGEEGTLFVGTRDIGRVYAIRDLDGDNVAEDVRLVAANLRSPNGVAFYEGDLYVAEISRVLRYDDIENNLEFPPEPVVVNDSFPADAHHGWKYIAFGPDDMLYVPVGVPCNICNFDQSRYGLISRMNPDGTGLEIVAEGVRNTVGFDWHPETGNLWFTDNGRDWLGDDMPPDELNRLTEPGQHFGFPYCHSRFPDPDFGLAEGCPSRFVRPVQDLGPHVAALGMKFYTGEMFPEEYHQQVFIAEHGSWNRTVPIGYRVTLVRLDENQQATSYEVFAEGWLNEQTGNSWGRPVDVLLLPDGSMLVSDDAAGAIYRIVYTGE